MCLTYVGKIKSSKWGFRSSGMWHFVIPLVLLKALNSYRTLRTTTATIHHHISEDQSPRNITVINLYFGSSFGLKGDSKLLQYKLYWLVNSHWHYRGIPLLIPTWYTIFYINYIKLSSSTCFERHPLIFRRSVTLTVHVCSLWYSHSLQVAVLCTC